MLRIEKLDAEIDGKQILNGLSLRVGAGEIHAIMGPNGAGKSTLGGIAPSPRRGERSKARKPLTTSLEGSVG